MFKIGYVSFFCFLVSGLCALEKAKVTVWVHGTQNTYNYFGYGPIKNFFYRQNGLNPVKALDKKYHLRSIAGYLYEAAAEEFPLDHFYVYGWSGKLSFKERRLAAKNLLFELSSLVEAYEKKYGCAPELTVITHSHGGNVLLSLALLLEDYPVNFMINRLVLLACPVQTATKNGIKSPLFEKVYSFYSSTDLLQVLDPQGLYRLENRGKTFFSERLFPFQQNIVQRNLSATGGMYRHVDFLLKPFLMSLPDLLAEES